MKSVSVTTEIAATSDVVYRMLADLPGKARFSPESQGGEWTSGTPGTVGATFKGRNANGSKKWSTVSTVTVAEPGSRFAYDVKGGGMKVATWEYTIVPMVSGVRVTETWTDHRKGGLFALLGRLATGVADRAEENRRNMTNTMEALGAAAATGS